MPRKKRVRLIRWWQSAREDGRIVTDFGVSAEMAREITAAFLLVLGLILLLSVFGIAGTVGHFFARELHLLFGYVGFLVPLGIILLGIWFWTEDKERTKPSNVVGVLLGLIFMAAFLHMFVDSSNATEIANNGQAGGVLGNFLATGFKSALGFIASIILLVALIFISFALAFNTPIKKFLKKIIPIPLGEDGLNINQPRVSVFATVKNRFSSFRSKKDTPKAVVLDAGTKLKTAAELAWEYPSLDLLSDTKEVASSGNITKNVENIQRTLANFNIDVTMADVNIGPTVTQYTFKPSEGVKLSQVTARQNDLALALAAKSLRMEAPVPGKSVVGVEVPNKVAAKVTLKEVYDTNEYKAIKSNLALALGRDVAGAPFILDLVKMPHLLVAGQTGSGKSVAINSIILTFLFQNSPADLRLILIDPKRVELTNYNGIPHLLTQVITEPDKTVSALKWLVAEMDKRYKLFSEVGRRNIQAYNDNPPGGAQKLSYIVCIIDELADLMAASAKEVEGSIVRIAQLARATGIHLIIATQRPSVDVITGLIKANIPMRIAFAVASQIDSRTIIDQAGAEKLLSNGDMLVVGNDITKPKRIQGAFASDKEIEAVIAFLKERSMAKYDETITDFKSSGGLAGLAAGEHATEDDLYDQAIEVTVQAGKASASLLQRRLRIGYARAARLLDLLEEDGIIGPPDGAKPRGVLVSRDHGEIS